MIMTGTPPPPADGLKDLLLHRRLRKGLTVEASSSKWSATALGGHLAELSGEGESAVLTVASGLVLDVQQQGGMAVWLTTRESVFYPPDASAGGVDLEALPVVRLETELQIVQAADQLVRSGAFDLLVLDLGRFASLPLQAQTRLASLAAHHGSLLLCLTHKKRRQPSLGSLVALRGDASREVESAERIHCRVRILKDKVRGPGWTHQELCHGPDGLR